ncbi:MAG: glutathione peroxidase [Bdellovibrionaceae bacterium]|nr:glutathione peroxidase [Pseudobdellovibrionaceae bacterium]
MSFKSLNSVLIILSLFSQFCLGADTKNFFDLDAISIDGKKINFSGYTGKVILIANTASGCGYTPQYKNLQAISSKYSSKGLAVLGFPSNDFAGQEPGTNKEIKKFCELNYKVDFQIFTKLPVSGSNIQPVFKWLIEKSPKDISGPVKWNFEKFLISKKGQLVKRYRSGISPESSEVISALENELKR